MVRQAAANKAQFICLPEAFDYISPPPPPSQDTTSNAPRPPQPEQVPQGARTQAFCQLARELNVWISLGGLHEQGEAESTTKHYNTHVIINSQGEVCAKYRKIHLFDAQVDHGYRESDYTTPGAWDPQIVRHTPIGTVGLTTCYDVRFPVLFQELRDLGCDVVLVPAAFSIATGEAGHWHTLLRARAIENQVYIAAAAQCGQHNATRTSYGHSLLVDPFGRVELDLGGEADSCIGYGAVSPELILATRQRMPVQQHRLTAQQQHKV